MGLTRLAIRRPLTVLMAILSLVLMGGVAYTYLQVDRLPPVSIGVVSVSVVWPNASAENVERLVAEPLENAISGISGVDTITSNSSQGSCTVLVQLVDGYDSNQADIDIQQAMGPIAPPTLGPSQLTPAIAGLAAALRPVLRAARRLRGRRRAATTPVAWPWLEHDRWADARLATLPSEPGSASVCSSSG